MPLIRPPPARTRRHPAAGLSLLESVLALGVLSAGLLALAELHLHTLAATESARLRSEALQHAQALLEQQRRFTVLEPAAGSTAYADVVSRRTILPAAAGRPAALVLELKVFEHPGRHHKSLRVTASWRGRLGRPQHVRLDTVLAAVPA